MAWKAKGKPWLRIECGVGPIVVGVPCGHGKFQPHAAEVRLVGEGEVTATLADDP